MKTCAICNEQAPVSYNSLPLCTHHFPMVKGCAESGHKAIMWRRGLEPTEDGPDDYKEPVCLCLWLREGSDG